MTLANFEYSAEFIARHNGPAAADQTAMLQTLGYATIQALMQAVIPKNIASTSPLALGAPMSEAAALQEMRRIANKNKVYKNYLGQGYYGTHTPTVILRNILENPAWYTAYTPYQPEISQGRLEALLNFQTLICDMTGLDIASASLLDEATAAAEAMTLAQRMGKNKSNVFFVDAAVFPQTLALLQTRAAPLGIEVRTFNADEPLQADSFGLLLQYPNVHGAIVDPAHFITHYKARGGVVCMAADLLALTVLKAPGELGADIAIGSAQRFGVPFGFGGPHAGFMACKDAFKRSMPGRLVGVSVDALGKPALRLALQTREQHIRREKATSNICTAQVLLAVMASMYAVYHGPEGLKRIAQRTQRMAQLAVAGFAKLGIARPAHTAFFDTFELTVANADTALAAGYAAGINLRKANATTVRISVDETTTRADLHTLWNALAGQAAQSLDIDALDQGLTAAQQTAVPNALLRSSSYLSHPVFNTHHSETEMLRYIRQLSDKDLALDRAMIPLGSCTMKLNATSEMIPVTWPEFAQLHPHCPPEQSQGYAELTDALSKALCEITGYDAISLQPNSGAQGEYAGLLAIMGYHHARGDTHRTICLIPSSAHGTNPASAQMCGMDVVVTACDDHGNVDVADLRAKAQQYSDRLAALMVTYPSTHGVFEESITEICELIHTHGGQVYLDGANFNALVGTAKPGVFGSDVSHLNLHKTFCIPHGGGGPGVGPIGVKSHLAPYLPSLNGIGQVSAAPYGSASILPISYMYILMMGATGLRQATEYAILNANYIARKLTPHYPILYAGKDGLVAHECIIDIRPIKDACGISNEDIAKRLMDFGFHAPTMSFPVAGTLMIEPTESESLYELDRFIQAMITIRQEIAQVESGGWPLADNPLVNAPHPAHACLAGDWSHPYSREQAAYPDLAYNPGRVTRKYWPTVARVNNVHGDKHLICSCPPLSEYI